MAIAVGPEPDDELQALLISARQGVFDVAEAAVE